MNVQCYALRPYYISSANNIWHFLRKKFFFFSTCRQKKNFLLFSGEISCFPEKVIRVYMKDNFIFSCFRSHLLQRVSLINRRTDFGVLGFWWLVEFFESHWCGRPQGAQSEREIMTLAPKFNIFKMYKQAQIRTGNSKHPIESECDAIYHLFGAFLAYPGLARTLPT